MKKERLNGDKIRVPQSDIWNDVIVIHQTEDKG